MRLNGSMAGWPPALQIFGLWTVPYTAIVCVTLLSLFTGSGCVRLSRLAVPSHLFFGQEGTLTCEYDMEGEQLYSVKWYKDGNEFFRYIPADREQMVTVFRLPGIVVDEVKSDQNQVTITRVNLASAGQFRCEISGEAPLFNTVSRSNHMSVIVLPVSEPRISGGESVYQMGETIRVNCTSPRSKPAATLMWYINERLASPYMVRYYPTIMHEDGLETAILGLDVEVNRVTYFMVEGAGRQAQGAVGQEASTVVLRLRCHSEVSTFDFEADTAETHHQKSVVHTSLGFLLHSGQGARFSWWDYVSTLTICCSGLVTSSARLHHVPGRHHLVGSSAFAAL